LATITWDNGIQDGITFTPSTGTTTYTVTADLNGCIATSQMDVIVNPNPTFVISSSNPITCLGTEGFITLSGLNNSTTYAISYTNGSIQGPLNMTTDMTGQIIITGLGSGNYTDFLVDLIGCTTTDNTVITLTDPLPPSINAGLDQTICLGDNVILTADNPNGSNITWNNGVLDGLAFQPVTDMTYISTATMNNCTNTDTVSVFVITGATINAGPDQSICYGDSTFLHATNANGIDFVWTHNIIDSTKFIPESTTIYTVTSSIGSCAGSDDVKIIVNPLPDATFSFSPNNPTVENTEVIFNIDYSNPTIETYHWHFGDSELSNLESPTHLYPIVGGITYDVNLLVTDTAGCKDSSSTRITVDDILIYYVPNAFTPDGDNINNTFQPVFTSGFDPQDYHLMIFNRWGEIVFETYNSDIGWDGHYDDSQFIQQGVYVWVIEFGNLVSDKKYNIKGMVTLIK
jgi:gliding motility-associated-like protein